MIITVAEARKLIGKKQSDYTDPQVEEIVNVFTFFTDLAIDYYIELKKGSEGGDQLMPTAQFKEGKLVPVGKGTYTLQKVEVIENKFYNPEEDSEDKKHRWEWHFVLDEDSDAVIRKWTSPNISVYQGKKSECRRLFETLLDKELTEKTKDDFGSGDTDILIGKKVMLHIKHEKKEGNTSAKIIDFESVTGQSF